VIFPYSYPNKLNSIVGYTGYPKTIRDDPRLQRQNMEQVFFELWTLNNLFERYKI